MSSKKDMKRPDLVIPYQEPPPVKSENLELGSTLTSTLPMLAIMMRNKLIGWLAVVIAIQNWLGQSEESKRTSATPGYFPVGMSAMSLIVTYVPLFLGQPASNKGATGTEAPPPVPPS